MKTALGSRPVITTHGRWFCSASAKVKLHLQTLVSATEEIDLMSQHTRLVPARSA
jgi:hypothetical protein